MAYLTGMKPPNIFSYNDSFKHYICVLSFAKKVAAFHYFHNWERKLNKLVGEKLPIQKSSYLERRKRESIQATCYIKHMNML